MVGKNKVNFLIISYAQFGKGLSGGDNIFVEFLRHITGKGMNALVWASQECFYICKKQKILGAKYDTLKQSKLKLPFFFTYVSRVIRVIFKAVSCKKVDDNLIIYSASDFLTDSLPAVILKLRFRSVKWAAGFFFFAPAPFKSRKDIKYRGGYVPPKIRTFFYYFSQRFAYYLIRKYADFVLVANQLDKDIFVQSGFKAENIEPIYGGVDLKGIGKVSFQNIRYDGCFVGRFHRQKGAIELIKIWDIVCKSKPNAKLAIIGIGPLEEKMKITIADNKLEKNIDILGYLDGKEKFEILKASKIFLHTPILDTGGMAAAEAMACGLPVVGFDLPGYKYCYPQGMSKVAIGDLGKFAQEVSNLLVNEGTYQKLKKEALEFSENWDWGKKSELILDRTTSLLS